MIPTNKKIDTEIVKQLKQAEATLASIDRAVSAIEHAQALGWSTEKLSDHLEEMGDPLVYVKQILKLPKDIQKLSVYSMSELRFRLLQE